MIGSLVMKTATNNIKSAKSIFYTVLAMLMAVFIIGAQGCVIKTSSGEEIKLFDPGKSKTADKAKDEHQAEDTGKDEEFSELPKDEQENLAKDSIIDKLSLKNAEPETAPAEKNLVPETTPEIDSDNPVAFRIRNKPKKTLPLETRLYPVPASGEAVVFDPSTRHRSNKLAALELTKNGKEALEAGNVELSITKFQKAISIDPNLPYSYFYFARARFVQKEWDQVIALSDKSAQHLEKDPVFLSRAYLLKAQALANLKRYLQALGACESAIDADSTNVQAKLLKTRLQQIY